MTSQLDKFDKLIEVLEQRLKDCLAFRPHQYEAIEGRKGALKGAIKLAKELKGELENE